MKKFVWILAAASAILFAACDKYDDSALRSEIQTLKDRVSAVEKTLNETVVPGIAELRRKLENELLTVTSVTQKDGSYVIFFSDGTSVTITDGKDGVTPVIGIVEEDGFYYWTINGVVVTDTEGNKVPVANAVPVFRAREDGTLEYSVDKGKTWQEVSGKATVELEETDEAYILIFGETRITLPKAQAFTLKIQAPTTLVIPFGETTTLAYTIAGAGDNEITEVDILNNGQGFDAEIEAETGAKGSISITNRTNSADAVIKVFVYATNHTGKSDIKAIVYKAEQGEEPIEVTFEAILDAELVPAAGGEIHLSVNSDEAYSVSTDADWISVATTKALYEDVLLVTVAENEVTEQRSGIITVASNESDKVKTLAVLQEAAEEVNKASYEDYLGKWVFTSESGEEVWTIYEAEAGSTYYISGLCGLSNLDGGEDPMAIYDEETGMFYVPDQKMGTLTYDGSDYSDYLFTVKVEGDDYEPYFSQVEDYQLVFAGKLSDDGSTVDIIPGIDEEGNAYEGFAFFLLDDTGNGYIYTDTPCLLPGSLYVPEEGSGSAAYNAWIGKWEIERDVYDYDEKTKKTTFVETVTDEYYIFEDVPNFTYLIYGIEGLYYFTDVEGSDFGVVANFNAEDNTFTVKTQKVCSFEYEGETYEFNLFGIFEYNKKSYYTSVLGVPMFKGTLSSDGQSAELEGLKYSSYGDFNMYQWFIGTEGNVYNVEGTALPNTLEYVPADATVASYKNSARSNMFEPGNFKATEVVPFMEGRSKVFNCPILR